MGLSIVGGSGHSRILAEDIYTILKHKYKVKDINLITPKQSCDYSDSQKQNKHTRPLCIDTFDDSEIRVEIGKADLAKIKDHVVLVKYLYEPESGMSINDNIVQAAAFGNLLQHKRGVKLHFVIPYLPYVRAHSVHKYAKMGFFQTNTLELFVKLMDVAGVKSVISIDPHSADVWDYCKGCKIKGIGLDPFGKDEYGVYRKYFELNKDEYDDLIIVVPDKGGFKRSTNFAKNIGKAEKDVAIIDKVRTDAGTVKIVGFREESAIRTKDVKGKCFLIIDDLISSGGTINRITEFLKENGARCVDTWVSHLVAPDPKKIEKLKAERLIVLDTIPRSIKKAELLKATDNLLAHAIYRNILKY